MPLLDHFRPPLSDSRHWESFYARWAASIADQLNESLLPAAYYAEEQVHVGRLEIDVATFEHPTTARSDVESDPSPTDQSGATATLSAVSTWSPPEPDAIVDCVFPDSVEVLVYSGEAGPTLVAAVELISPANKDRDETRRAFIAKCAAYLQRGIGLIIVDTVTTRQANLQADLIRFIAPDATGPAIESPLYAAAFRPGVRDQTPAIECWCRALALGEALPTLPLAIDRGVILPLDLELTYSDARRRRRMG